MGSGNLSPLNLLEYLWLGEPRGPNCACCLACRRASLGEGGLKRVVMRSSVFTFWPVAVERSILGKDRVEDCLERMEVGCED